MTTCTAVGSTRRQVDASTVAKRVPFTANERTDTIFARFPRRTFVEAGTAVIDVRFEIGFFAKACDDFGCDTFA
jgi:hypothetical protein